MRLRYTLLAILSAVSVLTLTATAWLTQSRLWEHKDDARYLCYFAIALIATRLRISSRSWGHSFSMSFIFVLIALIELSALETVLIGACAILLDSIARQLDEDRLFDTLACLVSTGAAALASQWAYHNFSLPSWQVEWPVRFVAASIVCFAAGNLPLLAIAAVAVEAHPRKLVRSIYVFSFPYYVVAALITAIYAAVQPFVQWYATAALVPMLLLLHRSLRRYMQQMDLHRLRTLQISELQQRTIEALALAIEKDQATGRHLRRMQIYTTAIGHELGMSGVELDALRAASALHDVGKLAVPDHISSKSGAYTDEEREKMKIHTAVGAAIVESAKFPYPVAPIVRSHHEKWDGTGYPDGLRGEQIPLGARVLAVVDCLDAMTSERDYRPSVNIEEAVEFVTRRAGSDFDPRVAAVLASRYRELETIVARTPEAVLEAGPAPYMQTINAARSEMSTLFKLHEQLSLALSLNDVARTLRTGLRELVPYDALALYTQDSPDSKPDLVCGDRSVIRRVRPRLVLPLPLANGTEGRIELFSFLAARITPDHLRLLKGLLPRIAQILENSRKFSATEDSATTDFLTQLPNARSLFDRLQQELVVAAEGNSDVTVLLCDLDGFKQVNDSLGHLVGNRVLQEVAQGLLRHTRSVDYVARLGGDEFVIILPGKLPAKLEDRIAAFRAAIREAGRRACGHDMIDGSFGAARYPADAMDGDELVACADQRMYEQKSRGKRGSTAAAYLTTAQCAGAEHSRSRKPN